MDNFNKLVKWGLLGLAGLSIVVLLLFSGYRLGQEKEKKEEIQTLTPTQTQTILPSPIPSPTPTPDPAANWKTYRNSQPYAFQLKYPPDWIEKTMVSSGWPYFESPDGGGISFNAGPKGGMFGNDTLANYCQTRDKAGTILEKHDLIIDNNPSVYCISKTKSAVFLIPRSNTQYEIACDLNKLNTCLQILSTFKFLE